MLTFNTSLAHKDMDLIDIDSEKKIAVLIDAENAQYAVLDFVLKELSKHGHILVKKAYGDWSSECLKKLETTT